MTKFWLLMLVMLMAAGPLLADVAPDPGYVRRSADLVIEADGDLSGYKFFLDSPMRIEELKIAGAGQTVISASGRNGAMRFARLVAISRNEYDRVVASQLTEDELRRAINEGSFPGAKTLLNHNFQTTIPESARSIWKPPVYRLSLADGSVAATQVSGGFSGSAADSPASSGSSFWIYIVSASAIGVLLSVAVVVFGIWMFRRSSKKI